VSSEWDASTIVERTRDPAGVRFKKRHGDVHLATLLSGVTGAMPGGHTHIAELLEELANGRLDLALRLVAVTLVSRGRGILCDLGCDVGQSICDTADARLHRGVLRTSTAALARGDRCLMLPAPAELAHSA
jgi:hypothetical protein